MKTLIALTATLVLAGVAAGTAMGRSGSAARPRATLTVHTSSFGRILADGKGRALYAFTRDRRGGGSRCYGECATRWPVYFAKGTLRAGKGVSRKLIGTTKRRDGRLQVTYRGRPLYYYVTDRSPGQVTCQNVNEYGGLWLVVRASGRLVR
jgi:predicted lipoprotein with Yx(FWY)xxD motif